MYESDLEKLLASRHDNGADEPQVGRAIDLRQGRAIGSSDRALSGNYGESGEAQRNAISLR